MEMTARIGITTECCRKGYSFASFFPSFSISESSSEVFWVRKGATLISKPAIHSFTETMVIKQLSLNFNTYLFLVKISSTDHSVRVSSKASTLGD